MHNYTNTDDPTFLETIKLVDVTDPVHANIINTALRQIYENTIHNKQNKVDKEDGMGLSKNNFDDNYKDKLDGIDEHANNYTHPDKHPADMITQDSAHRFATDAEKEAWNSKAAGAHSHSNATSSSAGFQSADDKKQFDSLKKYLLFDGNYYLSNTYYEVESGDEWTSSFDGRTLDEIGATTYAVLSIDGNRYDIAFDFHDIAIPERGDTVYSDWHVLPFASSYSLKETGNFYCVTVRSYISCNSSHDRFVVGIETRVNRINFSASSVSGICSNSGFNLGIYLEKLLSGYFADNSGTMVVWR